MGKSKAGGPRIIQCDECGAMVEAFNQMKRCYGCQVLHARLHYPRRRRPTECVDCSAPIIAKYNQTRCKPCQKKRRYQRQLAAIKRTDGYSRAHQRLRSNPERWARKRQEHREAYQRMVRDPIRHGKYLAWKNDWYKTRANALRALDPEQIQRAVLARLGFSGEHK